MYILRSTQRSASEFQYAVLIQLLILFIRIGIVPQKEGYHPRVSSLGKVVQKLIRLELIQHVLKHESDFWKLIWPNLHQSIPHPHFPTEQQIRLVILKCPQHLLEF